jgi:hypothetical protein
MACLRRKLTVRANKLEAFIDQFGENVIPLEDYEHIIAFEMEEENGGFDAAADAYANIG